MMKQSVPPLTVEELQLGILAGAAAYEGKPPGGRALMVEFLEEKGVAHLLSDAPFFRFIVAVDEAFSHAPEKSHAAIERVLLVGREALRDGRAAPFLRRPSKGVLDIHRSLLEAIATVPLCYGDPSPLERIFELAEEIRQRLEDHAQRPTDPHA